MTRNSHLRAFVFIAFLCGVLDGCAAYRKCGLRGCSGDAAITAEVERLLSGHPELEPPNQIRVHTLDHVVYLNGIVDTDLERQIAESIAREAHGVTKVVNSIGISGGAL